MSGPFKRNRLALALACVLGVPAVSVAQQAVPLAAAPLHILTGKSVVIRLETRLKRVLLSNPAVIDALAMDRNEVVVEAKAPGTSSLILWDESGTSRMMDVTVDLDVASLRTAIDQSYPGRSIDVQADGDRLILRGRVPSQHAEDELVKMAGVYSKDVVDSLAQQSSHQRQILLEVKVAEVDHTASTSSASIFSAPARETPWAHFPRSSSAPSLERAAPACRSPAALRARAAVLAFRTCSISSFSIPISISVRS